MLINNSPSTRISLYNYPPASDKIRCIFAHIQPSSKLGRYEIRSHIGAASSLNHQNIITIYEIGETDSTRFIATEFVDGVTLRQQLRLGRLTVTEIHFKSGSLTSQFRAMENDFPSREVIRTST